MNVFQTGNKDDPFAELRNNLAQHATPAVGAERDRAGVTAPRGTRQPRRRKGTTMTTPQAPTSGGSNMSNLPKLQELLTMAEELGAQEAQGKDVQIKFDISVLEAANAGSIDLTKDKHGDGVDDAVKLSEAYFRGRNKAVIFDHREPKQRKLAATTRLCIKGGGSPRWGTNEPMQAINTLLTKRQKHRQNPAKGMKLDDAHNTLMRFLREQLKRDTIIPDSELDRFCFKPATESRAVEDWLHTVMKQANQLKIGKLPNCPELDNSPEIQAIIKACNTRLSNIARAKGAQQAA